MKASLLRAVEAAAVALLAQVPALASSSVARHLVDTHPWLAAYVPVAVGLASALYGYLKPKVKPASKPAAPNA